MQSFVKKNDIIGPNCIIFRSSTTEKVQQVQISSHFYLKYLQLLCEVTEGIFNIFDRWLVTSHNNTQLFCSWLPSLPLSLYLVLLCSNRSSMWEILRQRRWLNSPQSPVHSRLVVPQQLVDGINITADTHPNFPLGAEVAMDESFGLSVGHWVMFYPFSDHARLSLTVLLDHTSKTSV